MKTIMWKIENTMFTRQKIGAPNTNFFLIYKEEEVP